MRTPRRHAKRTRAGLRPGGAALALVALLAVAAGATAAGAEGGHVLLISPDKAYVAPGGELVFEAALFGPDGGEIDAFPSWSVIPSRLGAVSADGLFVAGEAAGKGIVRAVATLDGISVVGHAAVTVGEMPPERLSVVVGPPRVNLDPGESQPFTAVVTDPTSGAVVEAFIEWSVVPDGVGDVDASGLFVAGPDQASGRVVARASLEDRLGVGDAGVIVGSPSDEGVRVAVAPQVVRLGPGETVEFDALVTDAEGQEVEARVEWTAAPRRVGTMSSDGVFTAGSEPVSGRVVATVMTESGPQRGFASVDVAFDVGGAVRIRVEPREVALAPGGDAHFVAEITGPDGEELDVPVEWRVAPADLGTITASGVFTAPESYPEPPVKGGWFGGVVASVETNYGTASDAARVIVRQFGPPLRLMIRPDRAVVAPGEEIRYETHVSGTNDLEWLTEWTVTPDELGTITPDGVFVANPALGDPESGLFGPRDGTVLARATLDDGTVLTDVTNLAVTLPGRPIDISVRPAYAVVAPLESVQFEATALGPDGTAIDVPIVWRVSPPEIGSVSQDGTFVASDASIDGASWQRPSGQVVAEYRGAAGRVYRGAAVVVIDLPDPELVVRITPKSATVDQGGAVQFSAIVMEATGEPVELPVEWRVSDEVVGAIGPDGLFVASEAIPLGHPLRTAVTAGVSRAGRVYWDTATVKVDR